MPLMRNGRKYFNVLFINKHVLKISINLVSKYSAKSKLHCLIEKQSQN